jgi:DNA replication and repair protein RecF
VHLAAVESRGFRNLADARVAVGAGITLLHGPNGAGKTNLLEAVYFGLVGRSFRAGNDRDLIAYEQPAARVELELAPQGAVLLAATDRRGERRHLLDGRPLGSSESRPLVSVFHPDRMELVKGPPAKRRAHFDRLVGALWPARADLRTRYGRTLAQRNALVGRIAAALASPASLATWDDRLAAEAVPLIESRAEVVEALSAPVTELGAALGLEGMEIRYRPRVPPERERIGSGLAERREHDLGRAYTSFGPQLDEVELRFGGRALKRFGSQGQHRIALLALLLAERRALIAAGRPSPLMLLDDVMSELDPARREMLVATLADAGQVMLTATEREQVPAAAGAEVSAVAIRDGRPLGAAGLGAADRDAA